MPLGLRRETASEARRFLTAKAVTLNNFSESVSPKTAKDCFGGIFANAYSLDSFINRGGDYCLARFLVARQFFGRAKRLSKTIFRRKSANQRARRIFGQSSS